MTHPTEADFERVSDAEIRRRFLRIVVHSEMMLEAARSHLIMPNMDPIHAGMLAGTRDALRTIERILIGDL